MQTHWGQGLVSSRHAGCPIQKLISRGAWHLSILRGNQVCITNSTSGIHSGMISV